MRKARIILGTLLVTTLLVLGACAPTPTLVPAPAPAPTPSTPVVLTSEDIEWLLLLPFFRLSL